MFEDIKESLNYFGKVGKHKYETFKAMRELDLPVLSSLGHDLNKLRPELFSSYRDFFMKGKNKDEFKVAAMYHKLTNPHHVFDTKTPEHKKLDFKLEAVADWYAASKRAKKDPAGFPTLRGWWLDNYTNLSKKLDEETVTAVNNRLFERLK